MERISMHSSIERPKRDNSLTIRLSPLCAFSRIVATWRLCQDTRPDTVSSIQFTWPKPFEFANCNISNLFFSRSWSVVDTRRYAVVLGAVIKLLKNPVCDKDYYHNSSVFCERKVAL